MRALLRAAEEARGPAAAAAGVLLLERRPLPPFAQPQRQAGEPRQAGAGWGCAARLSGSLMFHPRPTARGPLQGFAAGAGGRRRQGHRLCVGYLVRGASGGVCAAAGAGSGGAARSGRPGRGCGCCGGCGRWRRRAVAAADLPAAAPRLEGGVPPIVRCSSAPPLSLLVAALWQPCLCLRKLTAQADENC
jgi:hypothetical protein